MKTEAITCPNCGAPLALGSAAAAAQSQLALCIYCNSSVRLAAPEAGSTSPAVESTAGEVPPEVGEKVKQLIVDGERAAAIAFYAERAGITAAEAAAAVDRLAIPLALRLTHQSPLDLWAIGLSLVIIVGLAGLAAWAVGQALSGEWLYALAAALCAWMLVARVRWLAPKMMSTWVHQYGALGRARIVKVAAISPSVRKGGTLVVALLEVQPDDGSAVFRDEETWMIRSESMYKIQPEHVIPVRFDAARRDRVFPISPIKVWDAQRGEFV